MSSVVFDLVRLAVLGLMPSPWWQVLAIFVYAGVSCLVLNDAMKVAMIRWRVVDTVATKPAEVT